MDVAAVGSGDRYPQVQQHSSELIRFRDERRSLVFALQGGETIEGSVRWFDDHTIHIVTADRDELTVYKHAVLYYKAKPA